MEVDLETGRVKVERYVEVHDAGTLVNPLFPAPVSNANINTSQRITDVILGALAQALLRL